MAKESVVGLHGLLTANGTQMVNEFQRVDNAQRRFSASIRSGLGKTMAQVQREFSLPKLAKGVMAGFGIGGGMQVMQMGIEKVSEMWRESSEDAKAFAEYVERAVEKSRELSSIRLQAFVDTRSPGAGADAVQTRIGLLREQLKAAEAKRADAISDLSRASSPDFQAGNKEGIALRDKYGLGNFSTRRNIGDAISNAEVGAFDEGDRLKKEIEKWEKSLSEIKIEKLPKAIDKALDDFFKPLEQAHADRAKAVGAALDDFFGPLDERTRNVRDIMKEDPMDSKQFGRWERAAGDLNVDDMTRRGLGTGANYKEVMSQTNTILTHILEAVRADRTRKLTATFAN